MKLRLAISNTSERLLTPPRAMMKAFSQIHNEINEVNEIGGKGTSRAMCQSCLATLFTVFSLKFDPISIDNLAIKICYFAEARMAQALNLQLPFNVLSTPKTRLRLSIVSKSVVGS